MEKWQSYHDLLHRHSLLENKEYAYKLRHIDSLESLIGGDINERYQHASN